MTIFKTPMNLRNSYAEVGYLQSNKYKNHIPSDVNDPSGGLGVSYFFGGGGVSSEAGRVAEPNLKLCK